MGVFVEYLLMALMFFAAVFLIVLVLVQRGRGGGLAGALGGMGGQSAFGTKAGDVFTKITVVVATVWILLCVVSVKFYSDAGNQFTAPGANASEETPDGSAVGPLPPGPDSGEPPSDLPDGGSPGSLSGGSAAEPSNPEPGAAGGSPE